MIHGVQLFQHEHATENAILRKQGEEVAEKSFKDLSDEEKSAWNEKAKDIHQYSGVLKQRLMARGVNQVMDSVSSVSIVSLIYTSYQYS